MPSEMATLSIIEILLPPRSFSTKLVLARHTNVHYTYTATHILVDMMRLYHTYMFHHITALQLQDFNPGDALSPAQKFASQHCTITALFTQW